MPNMTGFQYYIDLLTQMSVNKNKSKTAPHKAVLLLTIIDMIEAGEINSPFIQITETLIANFKRVWGTNVPSCSRYVPRMAYPFFHLSSSPFWKLVKNTSYQGQNEYASLKALERDYSGAIIDTELFQMMKDPISRKEIKALLKSVYLEGNAPWSNLISIVAIISIICTVA